jgi:C-terminal processing protease CtpA/Prc
LKEKLTVAVALVCFILYGTCASAASVQTSDEAKRIERLAALGRLWGAIKFFHPYLVYKNIDWDEALVQTIPKANAAKSTDEYRAAIAHLLSFLNDRNTRIVNRADAAPTEKSAAAAVQPRWRWTEDNIAILVAPDYEQFLGSQDEAIRKLLEETSKARGIIFDLRRSGSGKAPTSLTFNSNFWAALPFLIDEDLTLPGTRYRMYSGYPAQNDQSGGYYSGFVNVDGNWVTARGSKGNRRPIAFLINAGTSTINSVLAGLQSAGRAVVIQDGDAMIEGGITEYSMSLADGVQVVMRTSELVCPDGRIGFSPDVILPVSDPSVSSDLGMLAALKALRGEITSTTKVQNATSSTLRKIDKRYSEMTYPSEPYRLLALFRFWNVINYFYPYKYLIDRPWDGVLTEYIPKLAAARNELEYVLTVAEMVTNIQDSHGSIGSPTFSQYLGTHRPPIEVRFIEGQTVITNIFDDTIRHTSGLNVGDIVVSVDNEDVAERRGRLSHIFAASTPQALWRRVHSALLLGSEKSRMRLVVKDKSGRFVEATLERTVKPVAVPRKYPVFTVLPEGVGYVDLARLTVPEVDAAFEAIKGTPAVIFDIRGYPKGTAWSIGPRLTDKEVVTSLFERNMPDVRDPNFSIRLRFPQKTSPSGKWRYTGKVVALINEDAISQSEHTCLFLEAAAGATFIGSPTNGTNGDVTMMVLPGNISVVFTGQDVRHADGRQLQRVGIQPHIKVAPTIEGIRSGRDEVLDRAIEFLKRGSHK